MRDPGGWSDHPGGWPRRLMLAGRCCLPADQGTREEAQVGWLLGEAAHQVRIPRGAEGDVNAYAEAARGEAQLQVATDAVEELEFEGLPVAAQAPSFGGYVVDQRRIVSGERRIVAVLEQQRGE